MKCEKCGAENDDSNVFCANCGNPIKSLEKWDVEDAEIKDTVQEYTKPENEMMADEAKLKKNNSKKIIIIVSISILGLVLIFGAVLGLKLFQKTTAINTGIKNGETMLAAEKYNDAISDFEGVLKIDSNNTDANFGIAKSYTGLGDYAKAKKYYEEAIKNEKNKEKLKLIFDAYIDSEVKNKAAEEALFALLERAAEATGDEKYLEQKNDYVVNAPSFNLNPGAYQGVQSLAIIKGDVTDKVYYTIDGSQPTTGSTEYTNPIQLAVGEHTIKAIEVGSSGYPSKTIEGKYSIVTISTSTGGSQGSTDDGTTSYPGYYNFSLYASSTLPDMGGYSYYVGNVMDGNNNTAWVEGASGDGVGEYIQCNYNGTGPITIHGFSMKTGYVKSSTSFAENGSPRGLVVYVNTSPIANMILERIRDEQVFPISPVTINPGDSIVFVIDSVVPGPADGEHDTAISEIVIY